MSFFGSQFHDDSNDNIDPALLEDGNNNQNFAYDVEMATDENDAQPPNDHTTPFTNDPPIPQRSLNPQAVAYQPIAQQVGPPQPLPVEYMNNVANPSTPQTYQWRTNIALRTPPHPNRPPVSINYGVRSSNPFEPLTPEWQDAHIPLQQENVTLWPQSPSSLLRNPYMTPPDTASFHGDGGHNSFAGHALGPVPLQPAFDPAQNTTAEWNSQAYNPGDRIRQGHLAPPPTTPTRTRPKRHRGSTASSRSGLSLLTCDSCDRKFNKQHELDHHRRYHGYKNFACDIEGCEWSFVFEKDLRRHMLTHNKAKWHLFCNVLGCKYHQKGFGRPDHLKRHIEKKHPGNLPPTPTTMSMREEG